MSIPARQRRKRNKGIWGILAVLICCLFLYAPTSTVYGYTDEQIASAKAWLSSHGYSPTWSGAYQAYGDYLNGMWWDEFGAPYGADTSDDETESSTEATEDTEEASSVNEEKKNSDGTEAQAAETSTEKTDAMELFLKGVMEESEDSGEDTAETESAYPNEDSTEGDPATEESSMVITQAAPETNLESSEGTEPASFSAVAGAGIAVVAAALAAAAWKVRKRR